MGLRPSSARWFEIVVPREDTHDTVEALARQGGVQFEWLGGRAAVSDLHQLQGPIARYRTLARDYGRFWPAPTFEHRCCTLPVEASARASLHTLIHWCDAAADALQELDALVRERDGIGAWGAVLHALSGTTLDLGALGAAGPALAGYCLVLPVGAAPSDLGLGLEVALDSGLAQIGVVPKPGLQPLCAEARAAGGRCLDLPTWLHGQADACLAALPERLKRVEARIAALEAELRRSAQAQGVDRASGVLERLDWFQTTARHIDCDSQYCWVTGWTSATTPEAMNLALQDLGVRASVAFVDPPTDAAPPSVTARSTWLRPFDAFTLAMGTPGPTEADPTPWVAVLVSLLFGYMCGDVGHGALIVAAGLWLRRRNPVWPLLVTCGLSASGFGLAYGHVFGFEGLFEPLWLRPLDQPMTLLATPVVAGALILTVGVLLHSVQSCWRGEGVAQRVADAAQLLVYWGLPLALWRTELGWLAVLGVVLCAGNRLWRDLSLGSLAEGLGTLVESTFTLLVNTLSFARVGAFALAHAALESAVIGIAMTIDDPIASAAVLVVGNLIVVVVEGVVVMIQTTRLILFEFFVRFFEGRGRAFCPDGSPRPGPGQPPPGHS